MSDARSCASLSKAAMVRELIALRDATTALLRGKAFMVAHHPPWAFVRERAYASTTSGLPPYCPQKSRIRACRAL
jgi:hypothetical protein